MTHFYKSVLSRSDFDGEDPDLSDLSTTLTETPDAYFFFKWIDNSKSSHTYTTHKYLRVNHFPQQINACALSLISFVALSNTIFVLFEDPLKLPVTKSQQFNMLVKGRTPF